MIIYKITNKINGKVYIGQTIRTIEERWHEHCKPTSDCGAIANAIRKHGRDSFTIELVDTANSIEELNAKEQEYIGKFNTMRPNGYNLTTGGMNYARSEETKQKMSAHQIGAGNHRFGKKRTPEQNAKHAASVMGEDNHFFGKTHTKESKQKMSVAIKKAQSIKGHPRLGKTFSEESRKRMSEAQKGRPSPCRKPIKCHETGVTYPSLTETAKALGVSPSSICAVLKGKRTHTKGFSFSYVI